MTDEFTQAVAELDSPVARMLEEKDAEIERLKAELAAETQRRWDGNRIASAEATEELAASQAREAKLRDRLEYIDAYLASYLIDGDKQLNGLLLDVRFERSLPSDDSALKEAIKQGQREVLMEAAEWFNEGDPAWCRLKEMAEEIK